VRGRHQATLVDEVHSRLSSRSRVQSGPFVPRENGQIAGEFLRGLHRISPPSLIGKALKRSARRLRAASFCAIGRLPCRQPLPWPQPAAFTRPPRPVDFRLDLGDRSHQPVRKRLRLFQQPSSATTRLKNTYAAYTSAPRSERIAGASIADEGRPACRKCGGRIGVAIGLAGGFVEPLESTGIMFIDIGADWLAEFFPLSWRIAPARRPHYQLPLWRLSTTEYEISLPCIIASAGATTRPFWREVRQRHRIPDSLAEKARPVGAGFMPRPLHMVQDPLQFYDHRNYECILFGHGNGVRTRKMGDRAYVRRPMSID